MTTKTEELKRHPLSGYWPDMPHDDFVELTEDVRERGVIEPIVLLDGKVLDGWHRYRAALSVGRDCPAVQYEGDDPAGYVISRNRMRRHVTKKECVKAVLLCVGWRTAGRQLKADAKRQDAGDAPKEMTISEVAEDVGVSRRTVSSAKREIREERGEVEPRPKPRRKPSAAGRDSVRDQIQTLLTERDDARAYVKRLEATNLKLEEEVEEHSERINDLETEVSNLEEELEVSRTLSNDLEKKITELESDLETWRAHASEDEKGAVALTRTLQSRLEEVTTERNALKHQLSKERN